jgi:hypothetical protein
MSKGTPSGQESADVSRRAITDREHFEFSVPAPGLAVVENHKHEEPTTYAVNVDESGETSACSCPADEYYPGRCKHRAAIESEPAVLLAATTEEGR